MTLKRPQIGDLDGVLVDLDGVVTKSSLLHALAWQRLFDEVLDIREKAGERPFDPKGDYLLHLDGKPRLQGVTDFLDSRGIDLPFGHPHDDPGEMTVCGLANRKNRYFRELLDRRGVEVYESTLVFLDRARARGLRIALVSSSKNAAAIVEAAGIGKMFDLRLDGNDLERLEMKGKPAPDSFLEAARRLAIPPDRLAIIEDATAGVRAGRAAGFALVVGLDRGAGLQALRDSGADIAVKDLSELSFGEPGLVRGDAPPETPSALAAFDEIVAACAGRPPLVFLDYDGTLTPIVERPELAVLPEEARETLRRLARITAVVIVSGRERSNVEALVGLEELYYAGSHGFDIAGPAGRTFKHEKGASYRADLRRAAKALSEGLRDIDGAMVEPKRYAVALHYRQVAPGDVAAVRRAFDGVSARFPRLRKTRGKKVLELRPGIDWDKGRAVLWLVDRLRDDYPDALPLYIGDDATDEDAFTALRERGIGILVAEPPRRTRARYSLKEPTEVRCFLDRLAGLRWKSAGRRPPS
jgi:alpha,alpha-trehalase